MSYRWAVWMLVVLLVVTVGLAVWIPAPRPAQAQPSTRTQDDLLDQVRAAGVLVVATDANYPPWSYIDGYGHLVGFDVDVAREVAARLEVDLELVTPAWNDVTGGNWDAAWDLSIGSMTPTTPRSEHLWFTDPYYYVPSSFAVHEDNTRFLGAQDLSGEDVGVASYSLSGPYLEGMPNPEPNYVILAYPPPAGVNVIRYNTDIELLQDLSLGDGVQLDAAMSFFMIIQQMIDEGYPLKFLDDPAIYESAVMALDKARGPSDEMIAALNQILVDMHDDGKLARISIKWLDMDITRPEPPVMWPESVFLPIVAR